MCGFFVVVVFTTKNALSCGLSKCALFLQTIWNGYKISLYAFTIK